MQIKPFKPARFQSSTAEPRIAKTGVLIVGTHRFAVAAVTLGLLLAAGAHAQEINGVPGSASATITIPGDQLPPPPQKFGGKIEQDARNSKPYWPARIVPPKGAPNVLLIITDDAGYGVGARSAA
jgi:hypothetical protein